MEILLRSRFLAYSNGFSVIFMRKKEKIEKCIYGHSHRK